MNFSPFDSAKTANESSSRGSLRSPQTSNEKTGLLKLMSNMCRGFLFTSSSSNSMYASTIQTLSSISAVVALHFLPSAWISCAIRVTWRQTSYYFPFTFFSTALPPDLCEILRWTDNLFVAICRLIWTGILSSSSIINCYFPEVSNLITAAS